MIAEPHELFSGLAHKVLDRAREGGAQKYEIKRRIFLNDGPHLSTIGCRRRQCLQQRPPEERVDGAEAAGAFHNVAGADIHYTCGHVGTFNQSTQLDEAVGMIPRQGGTQQAVDHLTPGNDLGEEVMTIASPRCVAGVGLYIEVEFVHQLPGLLRQHVAGSAHIFSGRPHCKRNPAARLLIRNQKSEHVLLATDFESFTEQRLRVENIDHDIPGRLGPLRNIHDEVVVSLHQSRRVLRPLQISGHPVKPLSNAREHAHAWPSTIQVSLLPPPWEEFTTSEPFLSATRVKPPGVTQVSLLCKIKGRKSRCLGWTLPST